MVTIFKTNFADIEFDSHAEVKKMSYLLRKATPVNLPDAWI